MNRNEPVYQFFSHKHLPEHLQKAARLFSDLALNIVENFPQNEERAMGLRKLLEAKDCIVRSIIYKE